MAAWRLIGTRHQWPSRDDTSEGNSYMDEERVIDEAGPENEETEADGDVAVPDGGWGWFIVFSAFTSNVITDGCSYSFGVLFTYLLDYFGESRSKTAWIGSAFASVPLLSGPIVSKVAKSIGYRKATILGGVITAAGFLLSSFANSVEMLWFTYGIIAGFGVSFPYFTSTVTVALYFTKKRSLANGIAECGGGVGTFVFAPLVEVLVDMYGWRGALLVLSAIAGNIVVCGALLRPISQRNCSVDKDHVPRNTKNSDDLALHDMVHNDHINLNTLGSIGTHEDNDSLVQIDSTTSIDDDPAMHINSSIGDKKGSISDTSKGHKLVIIRFFTRWKKHPLASVDFSVFRNHIFLCFTLTNFILYFWYDVPYVFLVDRSARLGMAEADAALLLSILGILHVVGNLLYGYAGDRESVNKQIVYSISLILCGVILSFIPTTTNYLALAVISGFYGLFSAATEALCSVIIVDILGLDRLNDAYGYIMFLQGVANLIGPPVAGLLYDISGSYDNTFLAAGNCLALAGVGYLGLQIFHKFKERRRTNYKQKTTR
ncbi:hypothetical protein ScPMuIL_004776 [Solemya velum]